MSKKIKSLKHDVITANSANGMSKSLLDLYEFKKHNKENIIVVDPKSDFATLKSLINKDKN